MPRRWTEAERREHSAFMKRLHQQRPFNYYRLTDKVRAEVAAALRQHVNPNASHIAQQFDVSPSYVCTVARAEGISLRIGRRYDADKDQRTIAAADARPMQNDNRQKADLADATTSPD